MISLAAVEALAGDLWPQQPCAVVAVPDARKGERLILATQKKDATRAEFMTFAKQQHAADLMIPSEVMIFEQHADARLRQGRSGRPGQGGERAHRRQARGDGARAGVKLASSLPSSFQADGFRSCAAIQSALWGRQR